MDTAELLTTELVTNALCHGDGPDVGVRLYRTHSHLVIEVRDGNSDSPVLRHAGDDDEDGRGLVLVEGMADEWATTPDGTRTWCTLPLTEGTTDMDPATVPARPLREMPLVLPGDPSAVSKARVTGRTWLTMLNWPGSVHAATDVLHYLVDNAVRYGLKDAKPAQTLEVCFRVTESRELLIDVADPNPTFPDFDQASRGELGRGLWSAQKAGAMLTWFVNPDFEGKTVRATMRPGRVEL